MRGGATLTGVACVAPGLTPRLRKAALQPLQIGAAEARNDFLRAQTLTAVRIEQGAGLSVEVAAEVVGALWRFRGLPVAGDRVRRAGGRVVGVRVVVASLGGGGFVAGGGLAANAGGRGDAVVGLGGVGIAVNGLGASFIEQGVIEQGRVVNALQEAAANAAADRDHGPRDRREEPLHALIGEQSQRGSELGGGGLRPGLVRGCCRCWGGGRCRGRGRFWGWGVGGGSGRRRDCGRSAGRRLDDDIRVRGIGLRGVRVGLLESGAGG